EALSVRRATVSRILSPAVDVGVSSWVSSWGQVPKVSDPFVVGACPSLARDARRWPRHSTVTTDSEESLTPLDRSRRTAGSSHIEPRWGPTLRCLTQIN